ncbi:ketosynthase chain-length factor [Amycolatopsis sp. NPDC051128]|uniref:ketosynthase chain-length factor n=1 Tax=Amycolatopsis sp. NPDC051128 TaxID=3155412 RepID=UPI003411FD4D
MTTLVTGIGVAAPGGLGVGEFWPAVLAGKSAIAPVRGFDGSGYSVRLAGQIRGFVPERHLPNRLLPQTDRVTQLALTAAEWALADADIGRSLVTTDEMGVVLSNGQGGFEFTHREFHKLWNDGPEEVSVYESFAWFYAANTGQISIRHGLRGPCGVLVGEQAGGLDAIASARRYIRRGTPLVVSGGLDSAFDPWGFLSQTAHGRVSRAEEDWAAFLPFDRGANGYVPGEGGAVLVLEDGTSALDRGVPVYGEIAGYGASFDPRPGSGRKPALKRALERALADAAVEPRDVDVVFADSAGRPDLDRIEAAAISDVFGPQGVPVTAPKAAYGRLGAGGGPLDVATALLAVRESVIPPTAHTLDVPEEYGIDLVTSAAREKDLRTAVVLARGYGGFNSALVVRRFGY